MEEQVTTESTELLRAIHQGWFLSFGGPLMLNVSSDFLEALYEATAARDPDPDAALREIGRGWGWRWIERINAMTAAYEATLADIELEEVQRLLEEDLSRAGWGRPAFDLDSFAAAGIIRITVAGGPVTALEEPAASGMAELLAGFFAGVFAALAELPMDGFGYRALSGPVSVARIIVAHESQIERLRAELQGGADLQDMLDEVEAEGSSRA